MERTTHFECLVDWVNFATVRRHLATAKSPLTTVLFVASTDLLNDVARLLDASEERSSLSRQHHLTWLLETGRIVVGADKQAEQDGIGLDMETIPDDAHCHAVFLHPAFLVHVPGLKLTRCRQRRNPSPCP